MNNKYILLVLLSLCTTSNAAMHLNWVYDTNLNSTTVTYTGSWGAFQQNILNGGAVGTQVDNSNFFILDDTYEFDLGDNFSGPFSWETGTVNSTTGDVFGFDGFALYAPEGYTQGDAISGSATFNSTDLGDLSLTDGESGSYTSNNNGNIVTYSVSVVPEPSSALLSGVGVLALVVRRRR